VNIKEWGAVVPLRTVMFPPSWLATQQPFWDDFWSEIEEDRAIGQNVGTLRT
jgi:hypothetical protein